MKIVNIYSFQVFILYPLNTSNFLLKFPNVNSQPPPPPTLQLVRGGGGQWGGGVATDITVALTQCMVNTFLSFNVVNQPVSQESRLRETLNLLTCADISTNIFFGLHFRFFTIIKCFKIFTLLNFGLLTLFYFSFENTYFFSSSHSLNRFTILIFRHL